MRDWCQISYVGISEAANILDPLGVKQTDE